MKFLCLAYGSEEGWNALSAEQQTQALAQDQAIRDRGGVMAAVQATVTTVTNWDGHLRTTTSPYTVLQLPLAGFSVIEAEDVNEVIRLVADSPCARARGAIEIRPFWDFADKTAD